MTDKIIFYHNPMSRGRMVHWMLEEVGAPYEMKVLDFKNNEHKSPSYLQINPMGKIPTIVHRGTVITEVPAILTYLADSFPKAQMAPGLDDPQRGTYLRWMYFGAGCLDPAILDKMLGRPRAEKTSAIGYGSYEDTIHTLEKALTPGPYVLGKKFTAVDLFLGSQLGFAKMMKVLEPNILFEKYITLPHDRPAFKAFSEQNLKLTAPK